MIINACFYSSSNPNLAEHFIQPVDYFDFHAPVRKISLKEPVPERFGDDVTMIVIGGSGIFGSHTWCKLREIVERAPAEVPIVLWGVGINDHDRLDTNYNEVLRFLELRENTLIGMRDRFYKNCVPCVSCMRQEFDSRFPIQYEVGLYLHKTFAPLGLLQSTTQYPMMSNHVQGNPLTYLWHVLKFLGSCETVITNSYHGAYWATLLKRRVVVVSPFSNKFFGFKYEPIIVRDMKYAEQCLHLAKSYPEALVDSRRANTEFYQRVMAFQRLPLQY